jgi:hypothetical protein
MTVWKTQRSQIEGGRGEAIALTASGLPLTFEHVVAGWRDSEPFRDLFIAELAASPYTAFFWELPALSRATISSPFECVVICSEALAAMRADPIDFAEHLKRRPGTVVSFRNLGGDAVLIVPQRISGLDCYGHFAAFVREAPREQQHALFQVIAEEAEKLLSVGERLWISTSGLDVTWVHVRLDSRPKYYQYRGYGGSSCEANLYGTHDRN